MFRFGMWVIKFWKLCGVFVNGVIKFRVGVFLEFEGN